MVHFINPIYAKCVTVFTDVRSRLKKTFETPEMFVWTRRMQFQQPCRKFFGSKSEKNFRKCFPKNDTYPENVPLDT